MNTFLQYVIDALSLGGLYAVAALGVGFIMGMVRVVNFAHSELFMIGAYANFLLVDNSAPVIVGGTVLVVVAFALLFDLAIFRPLRRKNTATILVASLALGFLLRNLAMLIFGSRSKSLSIIDDLRGFFSVQELRIPKIDLITIVVTLVLLVCLAIFFRKSDVGIQMRAAAENFRVAQLMGVRANRIIALAFAISGVLAATVSLLVVAKTGILSPAFGIHLMLIALVATIIGGMGTLIGAVLGGFLVGALVVSLQALLPEQLRAFRDAFVFAVIIIVMLFRPKGLFYITSERERV